MRAPEARPTGFRQLVTCFSVLYFSDFHLVHLTDAHLRVPTKASKAEVAIGELKYDRADDQEGEKPDEDTAYHDYLGGQGVMWIVIFDKCVFVSPLEIW